MRLLITALLLSFVLTGCGGGGASYRAPPAPPPAEQPAIPDRDGDLTHRELG